MHIPDPHSYISEHENVISLSLLRTQDNYVDRFLNTPIDYYFGSATYAITNAVNDYINEYTSSYAREYMLMLLFSRIIMEISYQIIHSAYLPKTLHLNLANQYIRNNITETIHTTDVARASGVSVSYLQKLFHEEYQHGIIAHVNQIRLEQACLLLRNTDQAIIDIADAVGFHSRQHFTYSFKKHYQITPVLYRKAYKT